jgi:hypothetical protein
MAATVPIKRVIPDWEYETDEIKQKYAEKSVERNTVFNGKANFYQCNFNGVANFSGAKFSGLKEGEGNGKCPTISDKRISFNHINFNDEVEFDSSAYSKEYVFDFTGMFDCPERYDLDNSKWPLIVFDHSTFRKRVRFIGHAINQLNLGLVSFDGVDLSNAEFHNVKWIKERGKLVTRNVIIDEVLTKNKPPGSNTNDKNGDSSVRIQSWSEVSRIYSQLRKNYDQRFLFNESSHFFIGEMEAIKKFLRDGGDGKSPSERRRNKVTSYAAYSLYKWLGMYGESAVLPFIWMGIIIGIFALIRLFSVICNLDPNCSNIRYYLYCAR